MKAHPCHVDTPVVSDAVAFHHLGIATKHQDKTFAFLAALGYERKVCGWEERQRVNIAIFEHHSMPAVEVIWGADDDSPVKNIVGKNDSSLYHLCYMVQDYGEALAFFANLGRVMTVCEPVPSMLMDAHNVSFHYVQGVGLIEILSQ